MKTIVERLTPKAREFVSRNRQFAVVSAAWLDESRRNPTGGPETWAFHRVKFEDGRQITLRKSDMETLWEAKVQPRWYHDAVTSLQHEGGGRG